MKKLSKFLILIFAISVAVICFVGCSKAAIVSFSVNGTTMATVTASKEGKICEPKILTAEGVEIEGWYFNDTFDSEKFVFSTGTVTENTILYAKVISLNYTVTYNLGYVAENMPVVPTQESVNLNGTFNTATPPDREGYVFMGWTDETGTYLPSATYTVSGASNVLLVATWEYMEVSVSFYDDVGFLYSDTVPYNSDYIAPDAPHTYNWCFTQNGWDDSLKNIIEDRVYNAVYEYVPASEDLFNFELNEAEDGYIISGNFRKNYPQKTALPNFYNDLPVVEIANEGFMGEVWRSYNYSEIYIPRSIKRIGSDAFANNFGLSKVILAEGVESISDCAFQRCVSLTELILPASLKQIGYFVFDISDVSGNIQILHIILNEQNEDFVMHDDTAMYTTDNALVWVRRDVTEFTVAENVTELYPDVFAANMALTTVTIDTDCDLTASLFWNCENLTSVTINGVIERIAGCDEEIESLTGGSGEMPIVSAFEGCSTLTELNFKTGLKHIGKAAFQHVQGLISLTIPNTVEFIGEAAIEQSSKSNFASLTMTGATTTLNGKYTIEQNCLIENNENGKKLIVYAQKSNLTSFTVPNGVTELEVFAFRRMSVTEEIILCEGITKIPYYCFSVASSLKRIVLPDSLITIESKIENNPDEAIVYGNSSFYGEMGPFNYCRALEEVVISENSNLESIGVNAFWEIAVETFFIPKSMTTLEQAWLKSEKLLSITVDPLNDYFCSENGVLFDIEKTLLYNYPTASFDTSYTTPDTLKEIGEKSFQTNQYLENLICNEGLEVFGFNAFGGAKALKTVNIPSTVTTLCGQLFYNVQTLTDITFEGDTPPVFDDEGHFGYFVPGVGMGQMDGIVFHVNPDKYVDYYKAMSEYGYQGYLTDIQGVSTTTFKFVSNGGSTVKDIVAVLLEVLPSVAWQGEGTKYFAGWYTDTEANGWGNKANAPFFNETESITVTLYAKWSDTPLADGLSFASAYTITTEPDRVIELTEDCKLYFTFTPTQSGNYNVGWLDSCIYDISATAYTAPVESFANMKFDNYFEAGVTYYITLELGVLNPGQMQFYMELQG